jgi:hypothetical protein
MQSTYIINTAARILAKPDALKVPVKGLPGTIVLKDLIPIIDKRIQDGTIDKTGLPDGLPWGAVCMAGFLVRCLPICVFKLTELAVGRT